MNAVVPASMQNVTDLGALGQVHARSASNRWGALVFAILLAALGIAAVYWGAAVYPQIYPAVAETNSPAIVIVGVLVLAGGVAWGWNTAKKWNEAAAIYDEGLVYFDGKRVREFRWADIDSLTMRVMQMRYYGVIPAGTQQSYMLVDRSGQKLKLGGSLKHTPQLIAAIRQAIFPHIAERCKQAYAAGLPVFFGAVTIDPLKGITIGNWTIAWNDIGSIKMENGELRIKPRRGGLFSGANAQVAKIANVDALMAMLNEMGEHQGGGTT